MNPLCLGMSHAYASGKHIALLNLGFKKAEFNEPEVPHIPAQTAKRVGKKLNVDFKKYPLESFRKGMQAEFEHTNNPAKAGDIALDHLHKSPRYYSELEKMEKKLERED